MRTGTGSGVRGMEAGRRFGAVASGYWGRGMRHGVREPLHAAPRSVCAGIADGDAGRRRVHAPGTIPLDRLDESVRSRERRMASGWLGPRAITI